MLPDGRIVSGSGDGTLNLWDALTGECLYTLKEHTSSVFAFAVLPDGHIVSGSGDGTLKLWDTSTGECLCTLKGHTSSVFAVAVLTDGRVVSGSGDGTLKLWNPCTGEYLRTLRGHLSSVFAVSVFPDGRIVSGSWDNTLKLWDSDTGVCLATFKGEAEFRCCASLPDGRIVAGDNAGRLHLLRLHPAQPGPDPLPATALAASSTVAPETGVPELPLDPTSHDKEPSMSDTTPPSPVRLFLLHAPQDTSFAQELEDHLTPLLKAEVSLWHEGKLLPGMIRATAIDARLQEADLVIPLVSADLLASGVLYGVLPKLQARRDAGQVSVVPVLLRPSLWETTELERLEPLPGNRKAISQWKSRDEAWVDVVQGLRKAVAGIRVARESSAMEPGELRGKTVDPEEFSDRGQIGPGAIRSTGFTDETAVDVLILTALALEYKAVLEHLDDPHEVTLPTGTLVEVGRFTTARGPVRVGLVEVGTGNIGTAATAQEVLTRFSPRAVFFVGVAGGIKDVRLGDVVAATKIYGFEAGKAAKEFEPRPDVGQSSFRLEQRARSDARKARWLERLKAGAGTSEPPTVHIGPIVAGSQVVASRRAPLYSFLKRQYGDALAVEMEGRGFLEAARRHQVDALVIRGISDLIDKKREADAAGFQPLAARHAAAFTFEVIHNLQTA